MKTITQFLLVCLVVFTSNNLIAQTCTLPAVNCSPGFTGHQAFFQLGIKSVKFGTIDNTTSVPGQGDPTLHDFTCTKQTTITAGVATPITITNFTHNQESVKVYIDYNNDGDFNDAGELAFSSDKKISHTGTITAPLSAKFDTLLRMRVLSDFFDNGIASPCENIDFGQVEEYGIFVRIPVISSTVAGQTVNDNSTINPFSSVVITVPSNNNVTGTITLDNNAKGTLSGTGLTGTGPYTIASKTPADMQATLRALTFTPTANRSATTETTTFTISINENGDISNNTDTTVISSAVGPTITGVSIPNTTMKIGDAVTATITVNSDTDNYTSGSGGINGTIGGFAIGSLSRTNATTYTATFTVTNGGTDVAAGSNIPVSVTLTDSGGKAGNTFGTAISQTADAIDANRPTLNTVTIADQVLSIGETTLVTFTFSEVVTGFTNADITIPNGTMTNVSSADGGTTYTATFTPTANIEDATNVFTVNMTGVSDSLGNAGTGTTDSGNFTIDTNKPTVAITSNATNPQSGAFTATFTFSEDVTGFVIGDITVGNGAASNFNATNAKVYTATITPASDGTVTVDLAADKANDSAGNNNTAATQLSITNDETAPVASNVNFTGTLKVGETLTGTYTYTDANGRAESGSIIKWYRSDDAAGTNKMAIAGATNSTYVLTSNDTGKFLSYAVAPKDGLNQGAEVESTNKGAVEALTITGEKIVFDVSGNVEAGDVYTITVNNIDVSYTVQNGNNKAALLNGIVAAINNTGGFGTSGNTNVANAVTATTNGTSNVTVSTDTAGTSFTLSAKTRNGGTSNKQTSRVTWYYTSNGTDSGTYTKPSVGNIVSMTINGTTVNYTVKASDIVTTGGNASRNTNHNLGAGIRDAINANTTVNQVVTASNFSSSSTTALGDPNQTAITVQANTAGVSFTFSGGFTGATPTNFGTVGSQTAASSSTDDQQIQVKEVPTAKEVSIAGNSVLGATLTSSFTYTHPKNTTQSGTVYTWFRSNDNSGTGKTAIAGATASTYTVANADDGKFLSVRVTPGDGTGLGQSAESALKPIDLTKPTLTITSNAANPQSGAFTATFTFSEDVTGFVIGDITVGNGTASNFNATNAKVYTTTITPAADGNVTIDVAANKANDAANNGNTAATQLSITNDETKPTVAITTAANPTSGSFTATFTFSEDVTGFVIGDITVGNGTASNFNSTSAKVYTATITPAADGAVTVDVAANKANDAANNGNTAATQLSVTNDETKPTVAITSNAATPQSGAFTATFTFSENVTGFAIGDITIGNGTASNFNSTSAKVYTATITPAADGNVTINVAANKANDTAGNPNTAATEYSVTNDETKPTVAITTNATNPQSGAFIATFTFSEDVTGFVIGDITVGNGTASNFNATNAKIYTATITPATDGNITIDVAANKASDAAGNNNTVATQVSVTNDETKPTIAITSSANPTSGAFTATFTFSENVTGFAIGDITVGNGAASNFNATNAKVYTATITPATNGAVTIDVAANKANDAAGNSNTVATQLSITNDEIKPTLAITSNAATPQSGAFTATFTFSENVTGFAIGDITVGNGVASNFNTTSASVYTATITPKADGAVTVTVAANKANDTAGNGNTAATQISITTDQTSPTVVQVTSDKPNGTYSVNEKINIQIQYSEDVLVTGTPRLTLETGTTDRVLDYVDKTATTLRFVYTVQSGDESPDLDVLSTTALVLNGGTIKDAAGNNAVLTLKHGATPGSLSQNKDIVINASVPTVTTNTATALAQFSATLGGNVTDTGGSTVTDRGVVYAVTATNTNPVIGGTGVTKDANGTGTGVFNETINGLTPNTQYSFRAYAINNSGTVYGTTKTFTTPNLVQPTITFTNLNKVYGDVNFMLGATSNSAGTISYTIVGTALGTSLSGTNKATVSLGNAGTVTIRATVAANGKYATGSKDAVLTIDKATLTATAVDQNRTYGDPNPTLTISYNGFKNGEDKSVIDTEPTIATTATVTSNVNTYDITLTGGSDNNYNITNKKGTLTIQKAMLTATAEDKSRNYGEANPAFTVSYTGFKNGENKAVIDTTPTGSTSATTTADAGTYDIILTGGSDNNYTITNTKGTLTVIAVVASVTTNAVTNIAGLAATFNGHVSSTGGEPTVTRGFVYSSTSTTPTLSDTKTNTSTGAGNYLENVSGLTSETKYYVRAYTTNSKGTSYGATQEFTTLDITPPAAPVVTTIADYTCAGNTTMTGDNTLIVSGTAENNATIEVFINATSIGTTTANTGGNWTFDHSSVTIPDGVYTIIAKATDAANNTSAVSAAFSIQINTTDTDNDGDHDFCDTDDDNDGVPDTEDNSPLIPNPDQADTDNDGTPDVEEDCDNDGIVNFYDKDNSGCVQTVVQKQQYGFSPNGDNINDTWTIENIELYPNNVVRVFNRSGKLVYEQKGYKNTWNGMANKISGNRKLPVGAYLFIIELNAQGQKPIRGWVYINY